MNIQKNVGRVSPQTNIAQIRQWNGDIMSLKDFTLYVKVDDVEQMIVVDEGRIVSQRIGDYFQSDNVITLKGDEIRITFEDIEKILGEAAQYYKEQWEGSYAFVIEDEYEKHKKTYPQLDFVVQLVTAGSDIHLVASRGWNSYHTDLYGTWSPSTGGYPSLEYLRERVQAVYKRGLAE